MPIVVGVAFKPVGKIHYYDPNSLVIRRNDAVIVEGTNGNGHAEFGFVKLLERAVPAEEVEEPLRRVLRLATSDDFGRRERNERRCAEAFRVAREKIAALDLPMKLIEAEWSFDGSQATFHFAADGRIDFRELVREIAGVLHARVQMHQVGARDHAKIFPAIGPCGRPTCCSTFLREFEPVSIKMAKDQNLAQNPSKFTGLCGKLMCCLRYEQDEEDAAQRKLPKAGMVVMTPMGRAKVMDVSALQQILTVQLESQQFVEVRLKDVGEVDGCIDHSIGGCTDCTIPKPSTS
jgi:cell fate regulator YaaT (PSP1 superfamily)